MIGTIVVTFVGIVLGNIFYKLTTKGVSWSNTAYSIFDACLGAACMLVALHWEGVL